MQVKAVC